MSGHAIPCMGSCAGTCAVLNSANSPTCQSIEKNVVLPPCLCHCGCQGCVPDCRCAKADTAQACGTWREAAAVQQAQHAQQGHRAAEGVTCRGWWRLLAVLLCGDAACTAGRPCCPGSALFYARMNASHAKIGMYAQQLPREGPAGAAGEAGSLRYGMNSSKGLSSSFAQPLPVRVQVRVVSRCAHCCRASLNQAARSVARCNAGALQPVERS